MKKYIQKLSTTTKRMLLCLLIVAGCISDSAAVSTSSKGKDFWLMFDGNLGTPTLTLFITSSVNTSGTVSGVGMTTVNYTVSANTVTTVSIPNTFSVHTSDVTDTKGIHVTAVGDVTVYGLNLISATTDAYLGLPTDVLGKDYLVMTYSNSNIVNGNTLGIVATVNGTVVTITPTTAVGAHAAGVPYNITMNQGQTYELVCTTATGDLTGTAITATQPIGVMGASQCANIPSGVTACDHINEMLPPTPTWGKKFGAVPLVRSIPSGGDTWRFLASTNGTTVTINGVAQSPVINKGQFLERTLTAQSVIESNNPILTVQFANGASRSGQPGDPFMMVIPPLEQFVADYTVINVAPYTTQFINIIAPAAIVGSVNLDGANIPAASFTAIGTSGYSGARITTTTGQHHLFATQPFGVFVYGFNSSDSYGYPGGESFSPIATVNSVGISPTTGSGFINTSHCWDATVLDQFGAPVVGIVVHFDITGANPGSTGFGTTDAAGVAHFCYSGTHTGNDHIVASVGTLTSAADFTWSNCTINVSNCPQNITVFTGAGNAGCSQTATWTPPTFTSTCLGTVVTSNHQPGDNFPGGTTPVTYTFTNGVVATCTFNVTVIDNTAPVPNVATLQDVVGECSATVTKPTASDNCSGNITASTPDPLTYTAQGTYTVHWTYTDAAGNPTTQTQTVIVHDDIAPVADVAALPNVTGECSATVTSAPTATDNCKGAITGTTNDLLTYTAQGTYTVHWTYNDENGNTSSQTQIVIVQDVTPPGISGTPSNISVNNDPGVCGAIVSWTAPTATDNCSGATIAQTAGPANGSVFPNGISTVTYTATDIAGLTYSESFTVTVSDNENPTVVGLPSNIAVNNDAGVCGATVSWIAPTSADNCTGSTIAQTAGLASGSVFPKGTSTVTYTATDASANTHAESFTVTVSDNENPTVVGLPNNIAVNNDAGVCGATVSWIAPTSADNCTGSTIAQTAGLASGSVFPNGTSTVTYTATDASANTHAESFTVTVSDNENPTVVGLPSNIAVNNDAGVCGATVSWTAPTSADNCTGSTIAQTAGLASGSVFPKGTSTVTYTATDASANTHAESFTVTVSDNENPTVVGLPNNIAVNNDAGVCGATVSWIAPTSADNCTGSTIAQTAGLASGSVFPNGTSTVTYTATDASANTHAESFTVTVSDNENPTISAPANVTINGWCRPVSLVEAGASLGTPTIGDNCGTNPATNDAPATYPVGATTVHWTVTDIHGHSASANQTVIVNAGTLTASTTVTNVSCNTANGGNHANGAIATTVSGGAAPYTYAWSNAATCANPSGLAIGTYSVTITDAHACATTKSATVCQPTVLAVTTTPANVSCNSANGGNHANGSVATLVSGGTGADTYLWSNSQTGSSATGLTTGSYTVTVKDANMCTTTGTGTVGQPTALSATATAVDVTCNTANGGNHANGSVTTVVSGSTGADTYLWGGAQTTPSLSNVAIGTYSVTVKDANMCTTTASATVGQPTALSVTATATNISCNATNAGNHTNGSVTTVVAGGTGADTYLWSNGPTTPGITGLGTGTYSVTVTDTKSCTTTGSATVGQPTAITSTITGPTTVLGAVATTYTGPTGMIGYAWSISGGNHICDSKCHHGAGHICGSGCDHYGHSCTSACHHNANHVCTNNHYGDHHCTVYCHHAVGHVCNSDCDHYGHSCTSACHHHNNHRCSHDHCGSPTITGSATGQSVSVMSPCCASAYSLTLTTTNASGCSSTSTSNINSTPSATITVYSTLYTTGSGWHPTTTKGPMAMDLKVFNRHNAGRRDGDQNHYSTTWNSTSNQVTNVSVSAPTVVTMGGGPANKYVVTVPANGHYLLIGKSLISSTACTGGTCTVYTGKKVGGHDDVDGNGHDFDDDDDADLDACTNTFERFHAVIKDQTGKCTEADTHEEHGSLMLTITPLNLTFTDSVSFLPVIYESVEGDWGVSVAAEPPYGFYSTPDTALSTGVTDSVMNTVQFQITDTGSEWTYTRLNHSIQHKGESRTHISKPLMVNERTNRPVQINIVPNPASDNITITMPKFEGRATIYIYDMLGRTVAQQDVNVISGFSVGMNISSLTPGVYMVVAKNKEGKATSRLLKTQ